MKLVERLRQQPEGKYFLLQHLFEALSFVFSLVACGLIFWCLLKQNADLAPIYKYLSIGGAVVATLLSLLFVELNIHFWSEEFITGTCRRAIEDGKDAYWDPKYPRPERSYTTKPKKGYTTKKD